MTKTLKELIIEYGDARAAVAEYGRAAADMEDKEQRKVFTRWQRQSEKEAGQALAEINKLIG